ncbi:Glutathione S-transferase P [Tetrabaena socialis]|uniref:Glutathione S-transferase P n=1 Tax=Tetrabaena socialis TaxID=47790 RepID=A0A2J7ZHK9_9CHLO|nr:Glutathione S-transferase P [Tetrabaena socialis]|eukprot:PNG99765.1 Glutathione S-transferase P [Tetrabaena socialis]
MPAIVDFCWKGGNKGGFPVRAPPAIRKGGFVLCYTPVIMAYLGRRFGLMPSDPEAAAHVEQVLGVVTDAVAEGRLAFHPKDFFASHKTQVDESVPYIKQYGEQRLPKYLAHWEDILKHNPEGQGFMVGGSVTVADLAVYQLPELWSECVATVQPIKFCFKFCFIRH